LKFVIKKISLEPVTHGEWLVQLSDKEKAMERIQNPQHFLFVLANANWQPELVSMLQAFELNAHRIQDFQNSIDSLCKKPQADLEWRYSWLMWFEKIFDACENCKTLNFSWQKEVHEILAKKIDELIFILPEITFWDLGRRIENKLQEHQGIHPWSRIRSALACEVFNNPEADYDYVIHLWMAGQLMAEDEQELTRLVSVAGKWQEAYRQALSNRSEEVWVYNMCPTFYDPPVLELALPHLGREQYLSAVLTNTGTLWMWPGRESLRLAWGAAQVNLPGDEITGELVCKINEIVPDDKFLAKQISSTLKTYVNLEFEDFELIVKTGESACRYLPSDSFLELMREATEIQEKGRDMEADSGFSYFLTDVLNARICLEILAHRVSDPELMSLLVELDKKYDQYRSAICLIDPQDYFEIIAETPVDENSWWGFRKSLIKLSEELSETLARR
jgi:hypothetical protein